MEPKRGALLLALALAACADGGSRGTGVSTVQGNVALVRTAARPEPLPRTLSARLLDLLAGPSVAVAQSAVEGITVQVEGTPATGTTDANGIFVLGGDFAGPVTVLFQRPGDGVTARIALDIPAGGVLTLNNLQIDARSGRADAERQDLSFRGLVLSTTCQTNTANLVSRLQPQGQSYIVRLGTSALHDSRGAPLSCGDLRAGENVRVTGVVNRDGTIGAVDAEVENDSSGQDGDDDDDNGDDDDSGPGGDDDGDDDDGDDDSGPSGDGDDDGGPGGDDDD